MAQKNVTPSKEQLGVIKEQLGVIKKNGLLPAMFVVLQDLQYSMIVKNRITGEVRVIDK